MSPRSNSFPPPRIFSNALLSSPDITSLIRDTEAHERALFSVPPPPPPASAPPEKQPDVTPDQPEKQNRRRTVFSVARGEVTTSAATPESRRARATARRQHTAVAAVLGGDLQEQIRRSEAAAAARSGGVAGAAPGDVDVEVLIRGAEKLCGVYAPPGAAERIPACRARHSQLANTLAYYEAKVAEQATALGRLNKDHWAEDDEQETGTEDGNEDIAGGNGALGDEIRTEEELRLEEEELRELEAKKKALQERIKQMSRGLESWS